MEEHSEEQARAHSEVASARAAAEKALLALRRPPAFAACSVKEGRKAAKLTRGAQRFVRWCKPAAPSRMDASKWLASDLRGAATGSTAPRAPGMLQRRERAHAHAALEQAHSGACAPSVGKRRVPRLTRRRKLAPADVNAAG